MKHRHKVLWIEDGALGDLPDLLAPINISGEFSLTIAKDASEGIDQIMKHEFDVVIVDIRLPPGENKEWIDIYNSLTNRNAARLGLLVLRSLLRPESSDIKLEKIPEWATERKRFGVLTVENQSEVENDLIDLGIDIEVYRQKNLKPSPYTLLNLIREVIKRAKAPMTAQ